MILNLLNAAGIEGYFANHSLRATNAMELFETHIDKHIRLTMKMTGHTSTAV